MGFWKKYLIKKEDEFVLKYKIDEHFKYLMSKNGQESNEQSRKI